MLLNATQYTLSKMNNNIVFNEELHEYRVGGILTPSVSQILKANGLMDNFRHNETSLSNGSAVHKALELHDKGILDTTDLDPRLKKCILLWENFKKSVGIKSVPQVEKQVNYGVLFAGTIDRVVELNTGKSMILDFKSGNPQAWSALQTAGYALAYDPRNFINYERCCVKIHWDLDRAIYKPYHDKNDYNTFLAMATCYHWRKNNGYLREE